METIEKWAGQFEGAAAAGLSKPGHVEAYGPAVASMGQDGLDATVNADPNCDLEPAFMGFSDPYLAARDAMAASGRTWAVLDLGCHYGWASYLFEDQDRYVGVDVCPYHVDGPGNAEFHVQDIDAFLNDGALGLDPEATFVVISYVPVPDDTVRRVLDAFPHRYVYYPGRDWHLEC